MLQKSDLRKSYLKKVGTWVNYTEIVEKINSLFLGKEL